jgi:hypothetical protein
MQDNKNIQDTRITQYKKNNTSVEYKYICIKKDVFDSNMIHLNCSSLKEKKFIEIIYKSPSVYLEGLYFKTPPISLKDIFIYYKETYYKETYYKETKNNYNYNNNYNNYNNNNYNNNNYNNNTNNNNTNNNILNPTIKLLLNYQEHSHFINILRTIDEKISTYINKNAIEIENNLITYYNDARTLSSFNYEQIIKFRYNNVIEIHMKSYLDKLCIEELEKNIKSNTNSNSNSSGNTNSNTNSNTKYIFTFNISNIYFSNNNNLLPLVKCNRCEIVL